MGRSGRVGGSGGEQPFPEARHVDSGEPGATSRRFRCRAGPERRAVRPAGPDDPARQAGRTAAHDRHAADAGRLVLPRAHRLPVAPPAAPSRFPALADGVRRYMRAFADADVWGTIRHHLVMMLRKRHLAVGTSGLLPGVIVHAADVQDADGAGDLLRQLKRLYPWLKVVFADSVYDRLAALLACFLLGLTLVVIRRLAGTEGFAVVPRRWVAERTLGWLGRWRRLAKDYEELPEVSETMVKLAMIRLMLHRLAHPNRKRLSAP